MTLGLRPAVEHAAEPVSPGIPFHPLANRFPLIEGEEFDLLVADVKANGLHEEIVMYRGMILDGRNRYRAAVAAGLFPADEDPKTSGFFIEYGKGALGPEWRDCDAEAWKWVISKNLHRRHLPDGVRAWLASEHATRGEGRPSKDTPSAEGLSAAEAGDLFGVSTASVERAKTVRKKGAPELQDAVAKGAVSITAAADVASLPIAEQVEIVAKGEKEILQKAKEINRRKAVRKRDERLKKSAEIARGNGPLPDKRYNVIYGDPAWLYETWSENGKDRSADNHYPCMDFESIIALGADRIAAQDCVLYLWTTVPFLAKTIRLIEDDWGFKYVSSHVWDKVHTGTGYWNRNQHEYLLIAKRGDIACPLPGTQESSLYSEPRGEHSAKPEFFRDMIARLFPDVPKIELFCRDAAPGWDVWGNQSGGDTVTEDELAEYKLLGAVDAGIGVNGPLVEQMIDNGRIYFSDEDDADPYAPILTDAGRERLVELSGKIEAAKTDTDLGVRVEKPKKAKTAKPKKKSPWAIEREERDARIAKRAAELVTDDLDELTEMYRAAMGQYDGAVRAGDEAGVSVYADLMEAILFRANGESTFGVRANDRPLAIEAATAWKPGEEPKWGQERATVEAEHEGVRALVVFDRGSEIHAVDFNRPFPSCTGFHAVGAEEPSLGKSLKDAAPDVIAASIKYAKTGEFKSGLCYPEHIYRLKDDGSLEYVDRGVFIDGEAPPISQEIIDEVTAAASAWREEESARYSGGKKGKGKYPERKFHRNTFIFAIEDGRIAPVIDFPVSGQYVFTASFWKDGERVEGLRYVEDGTRPAGEEAA